MNLEELRSMDNDRIDIYLSLILHDNPKCIAEELLDEYIRRVLMLHPKFDEYNEENQYCGYTYNRMTECGDFEYMNDEDIYSYPITIIRELLYDEDIWRRVIDTLPHVGAPYQLHNGWSCGYQRVKIGEKYSENIK